jgi:NADH-quinone oxidoreductase subunit N
MRFSLSWVDYFAMSPLLMVLGGTLAILLFASFSETLAKRWGAALTLGTLVSAAFLSVYAPISVNPLLTPWLKFDPLSHIFNFLFFGTGAAVVLLAAPFFDRFQPVRGEFYFLLLSSIFGLMLIGSAADFLILFLGIETLLISLYVLCGYMKKWELSHESQTKYFFMGSIAAAFLLYGIALVYGASGTTRLDSLQAAFQAANGDFKFLFLAGVAFITLGLAFEAAVFPVQTWAPDVYDGAPNPVTAFMAVGTKIGAFAALIRVFFGPFLNLDPRFNQGIALLIYPTLIFAAFVALRQTQMRRFFAYSGIVNGGFLLIPVVVGTQEALSALLFYLVTYSIATLGCFAVLAFLDRKEDGVALGDLKGLFQKAPFLAAVFALCLLTLSGLPPTVGFLAKFALFKVAFQGGYYGLVIVGLLSTILSAFYYLRIISVMFADRVEVGEPSEPLEMAKSKSSFVLGLICFASLVVLPCYPALLWDAVEVKGPERAEFARGETRGGDRNRE